MTRFDHWRLNTARGDLEFNITPALAHQPNTIIGSGIRRPNYPQGITNNYTAGVIAMIESTGWDT